MADKGKKCGRYSCLYHPARSAMNGCDYFLLTGKHREKNEFGRCMSYVKATPEEKRKFNEQKFEEDWRRRKATDFRTYITDDRFIEKYCKSRRLD